MKVPDFEIKEYSRRNLVLNQKGISYKEFLKSQKWEKTKQRIFKAKGKFCHICNSVNELNVHHNNYNYKNLSGSIRCLVVLCKNCHYEVHRISKINDWHYKKTVRSLKKRFNKYGSIYHYPKNTTVKY